MARTVTGPRGGWLVCAIAAIVATGCVDRISVERPDPGTPGVIAGDADDAVIIEKAITEVDAYWSTQFSRLYPDQEYPRFDLSRAFPYGPTDPPPRCGAAGLEDYEQVAMNAFYCPPDDSVAWDASALTPKLLQHFGPLTLGIVFAHELGHRVQQLHGILDGRFITFLTEQQADCFAGAWVAHAELDESSSFDVSDAALDNALSGFLTIRDPVGATNVRDPRAHGSAFQRIGAFEDGYTIGLDRCRSYEDGDIDFVPEAFTTVSDEQSRGNLRFDRVAPLVVANLQGFWSAALADTPTPWSEPDVEPFDPAAGVRCGDTSLQGDDAVGLHFYCPEDDTIVWDQAILMPTLYRDVGDMAVAVVIATEFSARAQQLLGAPTDSADGLLQRDCLTGVWAGSAQRGELGRVLPEEARLALSPGDLDEVVAGFLSVGVAGDLDDAPPPVSAFDRVSRFRGGFFAAFENGIDAGLQACGTPS